MQTSNISTVQAVLSYEEVRRNYESGIRRFQELNEKGFRVPLNLEVGTKLSFAEFLIAHGHTQLAARQITEVQTLIALLGENSIQATQLKCRQLMGKITRH